MAECSATLSGRHVFSDRGRARGGAWACACGARTTRTEAFRRSILADSHRAIGCPCLGSLVGCDYFDALNALRWQDRYLGYAEQDFADARREYARALTALRDAEARLTQEQRRRDELAADVEKPGDVA